MVYYVPASTSKTWQYEVSFLKGTLYDTAVRIIHKLADLRVDYEIDDEDLEEIYKDLGWIAGLLPDDYGFDGRIH